MAEQSLTEYPGPQQWYLVNLAALTWGELWRASGNGLPFIAAAPYLALMKLFRAIVPGGRLPREISFQAPGPAPGDDAARIEALLGEFAAVGLQHFTSFAVPELESSPTMYALLDPQGHGYADVTYLTRRRVVYYEAFTPFQDGGGITTVTDKAATALNTYPGKVVRHVPQATPAELWRQHLASIGELADQHGGITLINQDGLFTHLRNDVRRFVDFQLSRGVAVPQ